MARFRAVLAYDGTAYAGFQRQAGDTPTIQSTVEEALQIVLKQPVTIVGAGRTDAGVHATGQVIAFDAVWPHETQALMRAINVNLPADIALQSIEVSPGFHPRFDALSRTYHYHVAVVHVRQPLLAKRAWQRQLKLDVEAMQAVAGLVIGEHDFAAFGLPPQGENTIREIFVSRWDCSEAPFGLWCVYHVEGTAFLKHMVRRMVALMVAVGQHQISLEAFRAIFESRRLARAKTLAPPYGLTLTAVRYPPALQGS